MPEINSASIATETFSVDGGHGCVNSSKPSPNHYIFDAAQCRVQELWTAPPAHPRDYVLTGQKDPNGTIYYLPYEQNAVVSMRLPASLPSVSLNFLPKE